LFFGFFVWPHVLWNLSEVAAAVEHTLALTVYTGKIAHVLQSAYLLLTNSACPWEGLSIRKSGRKRIVRTSMTKTGCTSTDIDPTPMQQTLSQVHTIRHFFCFLGGVVP
jgi:hypothetical protein